MAGISWDDVFWKRPSKTVEPKQRENKCQLAVKNADDIRHQLIADGVMSACKCKSKEG